MYNFSCPMPINKEHINKLLDINNKIEKSKITEVYFALPVNSPDFTGFEQGRYILNNNVGFNYFKQFIEYLTERGFDFIYLLNSPQIYNPDFENINEQLKRLDKLINNLRNLGCNKVRVCNPQLMGYLNENYPNIELYISTSIEFQSIKQYMNLFLMFDNISEFVPSWDLNRNFKFLLNIKKKVPNIKIELMVNEGCLPSCPLRNVHNISVMEKNGDEISNNFFSSDFLLYKCSERVCNNLFFYLCNCNIIYPWEIEEYSKIGINKFKFVGRNNHLYTNGQYLDVYFYYLTGIDNIKKIKNIPIKIFNHYIIENKEINLLIKDIKNYLPQTKYFKIYGHLCASRCGVECRYCYKCAKKIQKIFKSKQEEQRKLNVPFCVMYK